MKEYSFENNHKINIKKLYVGRMNPEKYGYIHEKIIRVCHDVFIEYQGGILLVIRDRYPAKGIPWVIGGGVDRGMNIEDSLKKLAKEECGLTLKDIKELGRARTYFETEPFGHGKGTDSINFVYFARGDGKVRLDKFHKKPMIIKHKDYTKEFRKKLHPYIKDFMDKAMELISRK